MGALDADQELGVTDTDDATRDLQPAWRERAIQRSLGAAHERAEQRIQDFVDATFELIDERGSAEFTVQEVADRCGQSIRAFYQCFASKDELLLALFEDSVREQTEDLRTIVEQESDPLARLRAFTIRLYEWCDPSHPERQHSRHQQRTIADFAVHLSGMEPSRAEEAMGPVTRLLLELIDDAVAAGLVRTSDTQHTAVLIKQLVIYSWYRNRIITDPALQVTAEEIWEFCLHGIGA